MSFSSQHLQDKNAGNIGDLLKHFRLLELVRKVLAANSWSKVAYLESHAGAGWYQIDEARKRAIARGKEGICVNAMAWEDFERLNPRIRDGIYLGSFPLALKLLAEWKQKEATRFIRALLWEKDPAVHTENSRALQGIVPTEFRRRMSEL